MGDRQDIDALLIGALYGELDAAEQERLDAHLASHPADRATMDSLAETRSRVRDQLATMPQVEPAPAISTLILQEAARRAPRKGAQEKSGGVLAWLSGLLQPIARHPALAGAMALVLVGGAAGVLYNRGKVDSTEHATHTVAAPEPTTGAAPPAPPSALDRNGELGDGKDLKNADEKPTPTESYQVQLADKEHEAESGQAAGKVAAANPSPDPSATPPPASQKGVHAPTVGHNGYLTVTRPERQPKTLEDDKLAFAGPAVAGGGGAPGGAGGAGAAAGRAPADHGFASGAAAETTAGDDVASNAATQPPPKAATTAPASPTADGAYRPTEDAKLTEWAQVQHTHMVALVKAGNCTEAGKLGTELATKAPEYYATHVENDRAVRGCKQYIDQAKRKKANEAQKSRAHNAYEPDLESPAAN
jgi:hypothetical protein